MRSFEFTCKRCKKTVKEKAASPPEICQNCAADAERDVARQKLGKERKNRFTSRIVPLGTPMPSRQADRLTSEGKEKLRPPCKFCEGTGRINGLICSACKGLGYKKEK